MMATAEAAHFQRIPLLERRPDDFPFYRGRPVALSLGQWLLLMVAICVGLYLLILPPPMLRGGGMLAVVRGALLFLVPLIALIIVAPKGWTALFRHLRGIDFAWMVFFALLNLLVTLIIGYLMVNLMETASNAVVAAAGSASTLDQILLFVRAIPQLFGEKLVSILPFLALLTFFTSRGIGRVASILLAMLLTGVLFAAMHLPTYGYNIIQSLGGIGPVRLVLLVPYIVTKNIWVSTGAHILNDWLFFAVNIAGSADG